MGELFRDLIAWQKAMQLVTNVYRTLCEMQTPLEVAKNLGYIDGENADQLEMRASEAGRMVNGLIKAIGVSSAAPRLQPEA